MFKRRELVTRMCIYQGFPVNTSQVKIINTARLSSVRTASKHFLKRVCDKNQSCLISTDLFTRIADAVFQTGAS